MVILTSPYSRLMIGYANLQEVVMPGLSRLRGRSRFGAAKARASTFFVPKAKAWMAGSSPAMTMWID
ncbi:hypothetical protein ABIF65_006740 [Bradyrhizobium japonicum]|jgi:hypothetical protein|uniref:hypothetical protein n=1 Tax=Bradyrhizobium TaxID=374 RepID=UPI000489767C|nr:MULTISPECIES: hypothetical protein [Bradyrhizobium]MBR0882678.1 hypothetical protein [Bradyrhizobium liaoningense]MBR0945817.1 hypothetical protein [Bradyrhizobium liaoningense]MBR1002923.1 hypothetical protein [Bradyrhizobium liaoningense]MBR1031899.1 hypothetical protein [Bradyrhizobium liaoningense]MBR1069674.1 hypothetical protein [Bradyrhizobium liaoningense]